MVSSPTAPVEPYARYQSEITHDISDIVKLLGCQPILFVGSGLSKRYFGAPNWEELLSHLADQCPLIDKGLGFYKQLLNSPMAIGEEFAGKYQEWAWGNGHNEFPDTMFGDDTPSAAYLKFKIASHLNEITPKTVEEIAASGNAAEIAALQAIKPHAIISTNYDMMLELLFPDLEPIIGQQILKGQPLSIGEIFKIHGCISDSDNLVFTASDYDSFAKKKKFLSAKLLTFFNEHPLIFIGYSASDPNIRSILSDIDEALPEKGGLIPNVYILEWNKAINESSQPARDRVIATEEDRTVRVKLIEADDFTWVFDAFAANPIMNDINPKILRALIARSYHLVRHDIPKAKVDADFEMLTGSVQDSSTFAKLFGIANISDYSAASAHHCYSATQLGIKLGGKTWHVAHKLMKKLEEETGFNIKTSDNIYHRTEILNTSAFNKYSEEALELLQKVQNGEQYEIKAE